MSRKIKASLAAVAVAFAIAAAVVAPATKNAEAGNGPVAYFLGDMIESS